MTRERNEVERKIASSSHVYLARVYRADRVAFGTIYLRPIKVYKGQRPPSRLKVTFDDPMTALCGSRYEIGNALPDRGEDVIVFFDGDNSLYRNYVADLAWPTSPNGRRYMSVLNQSKD